MALSRVTPTGWLEETGTISRVTPTGWVQETQATGGGATTSSADPGSVILTGSAATSTYTPVNSIVSQANPGQVILVGFAATSLHNKLSTANLGILNLIGSTSTGLRNKLSNTTIGQVVLTGFSSESIYTPVGAIVSITQPGQIVITANLAVGLRKLYSNTVVGNIGITGFSTIASKNTFSITDPGQIVITGNTVGYTRNYVSIPDIAVFELLGVEATSKKVAAPGDIASIILKLLANRQELNPITGTFTVYDDDGITVLYSAPAWEDTAGTVPYSGKALRRIDRLTPP